MVVEEFKTGEVCLNQMQEKNKAIKVIISDENELEDDGEPDY